MLGRASSLGMTAWGALLCAPLACSESPVESSPPTLPEGTVEAVIGYSAGPERVDGTVVWRPRVSWEVPAEPGVEATLPMPADFDRERAAIEQELAATATLTAEGLADRYALPVQGEVSYDAAAAVNLDIIQRSSVGLDTDEMAQLRNEGFVVSARQEFPTFMYGYEVLYLEDLPLFVSADSILGAVHRSYSDILKALESEVLTADLRAYLEALRAELGAGSAQGFGAQVENDLDLYLGVALSLLEDAPQAAVRGADADEIRRWFEETKAANGARRVELFGVERRVDHSQFKPRGHYAGDPKLEKYFRAMTWLGRIDFRIVETKEDLTQVFHRPQLEAVVALFAITPADAMVRWQRIDSVISAFVGEPDSMTITEVESLIADLGLESPADVSTVSDQAIVDAIGLGGYGVQRISSHFMVNGLGAGTMPFNRSFLIFGQRYVLDSHVFSNLVYDRVQEGRQPRVMPDPLDVAFAVFGNDQAATLLTSELERYQYAPDLHAMRFLADRHGPGYWESNLYNLWLGALRALSPKASEVANPAAAGLPQVATTEAFGRRLLNTQLASWAELRHDTQLYAKQSYTGGFLCEFPDAYVEPYPEFFAALARMAEVGLTLAQGLDWAAAPQMQGAVEAFFTTLYEVSTMLEEMAEYQRAGTPFTDTHLAFINEAVRVQRGCGGWPFAAEGWYARLHYNALGAAVYEPTIADVHTQPTDTAGNPVGRVMHVATGMPRLMVLTVETCSGVRAYAGLVSSYYEHTTEDWQRRDNDEWVLELRDSPPSDVPWMRDIVVR